MLIEAVPAPRRGADDTGASFIGASPDGTEARELESDGYWKYLVAEYVLELDTAGQLNALRNGQGEEFGAREQIPDQLLKVGGVMSR